MWCAAVGLVAPRDMREHHALDLLLVKGPSAQLYPLTLNTGPVGPSSIRISYVRPNCTYSLAEATWGETAGQDREAPQGLAAVPSAAAIVSRQQLAKAWSCELCVCPCSGLSRPGARQGPASNLHDCCPPYLGGTVADRICVVIQAAWGGPVSVCPRAAVHVAQLPNRDA